MLLKKRIKRYPINLSIFFFGLFTASVSVDNLSMNMSNEVFESVDGLEDDDDAISSRTVSADKISTITEVSFFFQQSI